MKKQTAVEWLIKEFNLEDYKASIKLAKEIEKEQIVQAHYYGGVEFQEAKECRNQEVPYVNDAEDYYKQNYINDK
jgi:hypothetical protein